MHSPFRHIDSIFKKSRPIHLTFFLTKRCNSKCPFCFYLNNEDRSKKSDELSLDEIERISKSMGSLLWLAFSGGEIYLRDDLVEISRIFYGNNKPAIMLFPTNGLLPELIKERTEEILSRCGKSTITVKLSIDGLNGVHDEIRNTPGSFAKTMRTYELLGSLLDKYPNFELGVNTVFCSRNQDKMDAIINFAGSLKDIKTHTISLIRGDIKEKSYGDIDISRYFHAIETLERNLKSKKSPTYRFRGARIKAAQDILQRRLIHQTISGRKRLIPCYAGKLNIVLSEDGNVYPCEILTEPFGNVRDNSYDIKKVLKSEKAGTIIDSIKNNRCFCTHECYFMTNILFNPKLYPLLAKEYVHIR